MDVTVIEGLINSVGFPIVVCGALFYQNFKTQESYNKTFNEFKEVIQQHSASIEKLTDLVDNMNQKGGV